MPKVLIAISSTNCAYGGMPWVHGALTGMSWITNGAAVSITWNGTTVSWYSTSATAQLNISNHVHYYVAIG